MITIRPAGERGHSDLGWLSSYHTFSFGGYRDPNHMGFRALRVLNDDRIAPGKGFGAHGHRDMEILSYVLDGELAHHDSMGERQTIGPNEVQVMSAGTGVIHSEFNASATDPVHFLQIWILPAQEDVEPRYQQVIYRADEKRGHLRLMAAPGSNQRPGVVSLHQDARMYGGVLGLADRVTHELTPGRHAWVHCATGEAIVNGIALREGDGLAVSDERSLSFCGSGAAGGELLLFDLP